MNNYGYIYKTTNLINGRIYIGQRHGTFTSKYIGSGKILKQAIQKYGRENFIIEALSFATTKPMLDSLEMKHIYEHRQVFGEMLYNIANGGQGGSFLNKHPMTGKNHSIASKIKNRDSHKGKSLPHTEEWNKNISISRKGYKHSLNTKNKMIIKAKERFNMPENNPMYKKKHTEESKQKMREKRLQYHIGNKNAIT